MQIKKAYEYIFTGRNDQILDVNIQYNEGIALLLPTERGLLGDSSLNASSVLNSTSVPKNQSAKDGGIDKLNESAKKDGMGFFDALKELKNTAESTLSAIGKAANFSNEQIKDLIDNETVTGGMIPKINTCLDAVNNGVTAVGIIDGREKHSILFEIFSDKGSGTLIRK